MAIPTITKMQQTAQQMLDASKKQQAASTAATQSGSTSTPTVSSTPKVTQTQKAQPSVQQTSSVPGTQVTVQAAQQTPNLQSINLFKPQEQIQTAQQLSQQYGNILNTKTENKDIQNTTMPVSTVRAVTQMGGSALKAVAQTLYDQGTEYIKEKVGGLKLKVDAAKQAYNLFDRAYKGTLNEMYTDITGDIKQERESGEGVGIIRDTVANTLEGLPRGLTRAEYGIAELIDWGVDAQWATDLKNSIEKDLDYWENTRVYKRVKEAESFKDVLKNPLMYAGGTLGEMLPMFISAWVAIPTTFAQVYGETYRDYANDPSLQDAGLTDNQIRLMSLGVAGVNTLIELGSDLVEGIMPWTRTAAKGAEKKVRTSLTKPFMNIFKNVVKGGLSEGIEEVLQNEIQDQVASYYGSDRDLPTWADRLTTFGISAVIGGILQGGNIMVELNQHKELQKAFEEWSEAVDDIAPGVSQEEKEKLFSAIVAAEIQDQQMSDRQVNKYQRESEQLYAEKESLTEQLNIAKDETTKQSLNRQIEDIDARIKSIDEIINQGQKVLEEVNQKIQELSQKEELPAQIRGITNREGGENLSEQTMEDATVTDSNRLKELNKVGKKSLNPFGGDTQDFFSLLDKVSKMKPDKAVSEFLKYNKDSLSKMKEGLTNYVRNGGGTRINLEDAKYALEQLINAEQKMEELINEKNEIENRIKEEEEKKREEEKKNQKDIKDMTFDEYWNAYEASYTASDESISDALRDYTLLKVDSELSKHLIGLTNQDIRDIKNSLTDEQIKKINEMFAMISSTLGIDFNLVVKDRKFGLSVTDESIPGKDVLTRGVMMWKDKKFLGKLLDAGVIITLNKGETEAASTLAHELSHLVDVTWAFERLSQPTYVSGKYKEYYSLLGDGKKLDSKRDTYKFTKWARKNKIKQTRKFMKYRHEPTEVRARYNQQYMAYINDKELFNKMADENLFDAAGGINDEAKFRTKEEFEKLLPAFYDIYENQLAEYRISEKNSIYYDAMVMLNKMRDNKLEVINKTEELDRIEKQYPNQTSKILNMIFDLEAQYLEALDMVERMEGNIGEDMRKEYEAELSTLYSNFQMLIEKEEQYIEIQRETIEQQIQQDLMGEQPETMIDIKKESDDENDIEKIEDESSQEIEDEGEPETEQGGEPETTTQVVKDAFSKQTRGTEKQKKAFKIMDTQIGQAVKDVITPAISRLYNISPRIAGRVIQMETQRDINIHRYRERAKSFVEAISKLDDKSKLEIKKALLDFGALASEIAEQGPEALNNYKQQQTQKIKDIFNKNGIDEKAATDMFNVLNELGQKYKDAGLAINLTDMYFPRTVINYEGLSEYISEITGLPQKETDGLVKRIAKISRNENMTDVEKEAEIRGLLTRDFRTPSTTSKYGKNRLLGELAAWDDGTNRIWSYYADPMESLDNYIVNMENAIQRQLLLGGLQEDAGLRGENVSLSEIVEGLVEQDKISESQLKEAKKTLLSILDKKPSLKIVTTAKNITYIATLTNFISAVNQLDDLGMTIIRNKSGLKNIVKTIFKKADIKYTDLGLEDSYEMFRGQGKITNWLFKKSGFNALDRLGKTSFINTAWESLISQAEKRPDGSDTKTRRYLMSRLEQMYGKDTMKHMMEKIDSKNYMTDGQIDIDILTDLLYQLGSTQPLYTSAMPTAYLNNPRIRLCYALQSFTIKRIDWLVQGTKEVNKKHGPVAAGAWLMGVSVFLAAFGVAIGDLQDLIKGEEEETVLWKIINEGINEALNEVRKEGKASWLKIWNVSLYDKKTYKWQGGWGVFMSKMKPAILGIGKNFLEAVTEHNEDEMTDLIQYIPIIGKFLYYRFFAEIESSTSSSKYSVGGKVGGNKGSSGGKYSVGGKLK